MHIYSEGTSKYVQAWPYRACIYSTSCPGDRCKVFCVRGGSTFYGRQRLLPAFLLFRLPWPVIEKREEMGKGQCTVF